MKYLLDTCTISDFVKGEKSTLLRLKETPPFDIAISSITIMEIEYGLLLNKQRAEKIKGIIYNFLNSLTILPFTTETAEQAGVIRAALKHAGRPVGSYDLLIAATVVTNQLILVTSNTQEFSHILNLTQENWRGTSK